MAEEKSLDVVNVKLAKGSEEGSMATNPPAEKRQHGSIKIVKEWDAAEFSKGTKTPDRHDVAMNSIRNLKD